MTDEERSEWLARLRPGDRVALKRVFSPWVLGCTLAERRRPYGWAPDTWRWLVGVDAREDFEEQSLEVEESRLVPLPYPGMTGVAYVGPPEPVRPRRRRPKARTATA